MQGLNLSKISNTVISFFSKKITPIDNIVKFVKRKSKLTANLFVESLVIGCMSDPKMSLEHMCRVIKKRGVTISKEGVHQRFNQEATELMKNVFKQSLQHFTTETSTVINL